MGNPTQHSYLFGSSPEPLVYDTVAGLIGAAGNGWADRPAVIARHQGVTLTYADLHRRAGLFAAGLLARGLKRGDRVALWAPNRWEWPVVQLGLARAGLVLVSLNPAYRLSEVEYALNKSAASALIVGARFRDSDYRAMLAELAPELTAAAPGELAAKRLKHLKLVIDLDPEAAAGTLAFADLLAAGAAPEAQDRLDLAETRPEPDDPATVVFLSGATGFPKGVTLSHFTLVNNCRFTAEALNLGPEDRLCLPTALYHAFGLATGNLGCFSSGACVVYPSEGFDAAAVLSAIEAERCTAIYVLPATLAALLHQPGLTPQAVASLRTGIAAAPCGEGVLREAVERLHLPELTIAYGMAETGPICFHSRYADPADERLSTLGHVMAHVEAKVVDQGGRVVPRGTAGELLIRGHAVMRGYWGDETKTKEAIDLRGWLHTGDQVMIDDEGDCHFVGRIKDVVMRGGEPIYPREIEEFLYRHPKIQDVQVFGVPDARHGEQLAAWIKTRVGETLTEDEVRAFCESRIARFKIPYYVRFVDDFPMTVAGEVKKSAMKAAMIAELGLGEVAPA